ncbi:hypothetical protein BOX15_Mlig011616g1, partial [Macrostomum lignano]
KMTANSAKQLAKLGQYLQKFCKTTDFNRVMAKAVPVACTKNTCTVELAIDTEHANTYGTLHGGLTASLVDTMTTMALVANDSPPGVSVELSVSTCDRRPWAARCSSTPRLSSWASRWPS